MKKVILAITIFIASCNVMAKNLSEREDVKKFIHKMVTKHKFDQQQLNKTFNQITLSPEVIKRITTPFEKISWNKYQKHFITKARIEQGKLFLKTHHKTLKAAELKFGVPTELIVAIIGVETFYGKQKGNFPILQSLATLAFNYPPRSKFFAQELEQFLLLSKEKKIDPLQLKGSYAGAMGIPQFISSSYRKYAVNLDSSNTVDLNNINHAIASIANYLKAHGWQKNQPIAELAVIHGNKYNILTKDNNNPKPKHSLEYLSKLNVLPKQTNNKILHKLPTNKQAKKTAAFLELVVENNSKQHWLGYNNFYVITMYNPSVNYAMAVFTLSEKIKQSGK